ncbi:MAG TPA: ATP-binding protein [Candidatus Polarisedimenticolia bacterium]
MKLGTKVVLAMALPLIGIVILSGYLNERRSRTLLQQEVIREGRGMARVAKLAMEDYVRDRQLEDARELVDTITGYERVLGFRLFDRDGSLVYQSSGLGSSPMVAPDALKTVLTKRTTLEMQTLFGGEPVIAFLLPLADTQGQSLGAVQVLQLESFVEQAAQASRRSFVTLTAVMIAATGVVVLFVTRFTVGRPIEDLVRSLREVGSGDLRARALVRRNDEFGRLAAEFNLMTERLGASQRSLQAEQEERRRTEARLRNAERLASLGRLAAGLAHEIGTPLNVIGGRADGLLRKLTGHEVAEKNLRIIVAQIDRIARIVRGMLDFARTREARIAPTDAGATLRKVLEFLEPRFEQGRVRLVCDLHADLPRIPADADQLTQVFLNLASNALDAMPDGGTLRVGLERVARPDPEGTDAARSYLVVAMEDDGVGIAREHLDRIFDPFFSTKDVGKGTGLGLSISYGIVRDHGGFIEVESQERRGARFRVHLPLDPAAALRAAAGGGRA